MTVKEDQTTLLDEELTITSKKFNHNLIPWVGLGLIVLLGTFLRFYKLGEYSIGNTYYAATVQSMLTSWKNFFFAAFEPGGSVTVDKPPLGFWVQAVSGYFLGVNGFSLALPQALAGVLSIPLLYILVKKYFGIYAGLVSAAVLAVVPVTVATERNNTIDGLLVFVLLLAAWAFITATESGKLRYLVLGAILVGLGFNIKMLQAFMPLPAFYGIYFIGAKQTWWKRIIHLSAASVVLVVVSLSWAVVVDMIPPEDRPFIGSSTNNTVMELIVGHNGLSRLGLNQRGPDRNALRVRDDGQSGPPPQDGGQGFVQPPQGNGPPNPPQAGFPPKQGNQQPGNNFPPPPNNNQAGQSQRPPNQPGGDGPQDGGRGPGRNGEVGEASALRMFTEPLVTEMSWLLPFGIMGGFVALFAIRWSWPLNEKHIGIFLWSGWLLPSLAYFSFTTGLFHRYYLIMVGPPLAALVGITIWAVLQFMKRNRYLGWGLTFILSGITIAFEIFTVKSYPDYSIVVTVVSLISWIFGMGLLLLGSSNKWLRKAAITIVLIGLLIAPFTWSLMTTLNTNPNVALPTAGTNSDQRTPPNAPDLTMDSRTEKILEFLLENTNPDSYLMATLNARGAAPYILATSRPVLTFGGFKGSDDVISAEEFAVMVDNDEIQYVLGLPNQKRDITKWMVINCSIVNPETGFTAPMNFSGFGNNPGNPQSEQGGLYDCGSS
jgi:4-amino-4-deoxy-L-arabinose transferase-like glycosyltransferase